MNSEQRSEEARWLEGDHSLAIELERQRQEQEDAAREDAELWETIKRSATLSVAPNFAGLYARIVWDGVPYTGVGWTTGSAFTDLWRRIKERRS